MSSIKRKAVLLLLLLFLAGAVFTGRRFWLEKEPDVRSEAVYEGIREDAFGRDSGGAETAEEAGARRPDFSALRERYPEVAAWILSPGTVIDYPVVQAQDNEYYLTHLADGTPNRNGAVFIDCRNEADFSDRLTVLYGHHIRGGRMFTPLTEYRSQAYYEEHPYVWLYTPETTYRLRLFAGVVTDAGAESFPFDLAEEDAGEWLSGLTARSAFRADFAPDAGGRFAALCTCTYDFADARFVVYGELEEEGKEEGENAADDSNRTDTEK